MAEYFTSDHFKLLVRWKGRARDPSNPEQNQAYEDLARAYAVTEAWAIEVQKRLFPHGRVEVRKLKCLPGFRHIRTDSAHLLATRMPLLEVFIAEFLAAVEHVVTRGLRRDYVSEQSNLFALRPSRGTATHRRRRQRCAVAAVSDGGAV